jgi:hypothetical protein
VGKLRKGEKRETLSFSADLASLSFMPRESFCCSMKICCEGGLFRNKRKEKEGRRDYRSGDVILGFACPSSSQTFQILFFFSFFPSQRWYEMQGI